MLPESLETPDKEKTKISKGKAKTNEGQELENVREIISQHINIMMDSLTTEGKSKFKHMLDDEKISNAATEVVTTALRSTKDTIVARSDLYDFYKVRMASFRNESGLTVTSRRHIPELKSKNSSAASVGSMGEQNVG